MMKPHCDHCDKLIEEAPPTWIDISDRYARTYHMSLFRGSRDEEYDLCIACKVLILSLFIQRMGRACVTSVLPK